MDGIHIHPHDILDEGPKRIIEHIQAMKGVNYIFPQVNTIFERNPYPIGELPHNPVRSVVMGTGTFHANIDIQEISPQLYQLVDSTIIEGQDPIFLFKEYTKDTSFQVIPWFNILNGHFQGNLEDNAIVNIHNEIVDYWLCPNGPDVLFFWTSTILEFVKTYGYSTIMIDRIRYPDWAGHTIDPYKMFSCFCKHCKNKMESTGLNLKEIEKDINIFIEQLQQGKYEQAVTFFKEQQALQEWVKFRQDSISQFVQQFIHQVKQEYPKVEFWLDLWPPSYAWFLGQDYTTLTKFASRLKHFPYHKLGGGADVQGLIEFIGSNDSDQEKAFQAFLRFFDIDQKLSYEVFKQDGYTIDFILQENEKVRKLSQTGTVIYSGTQIWNIDQDALVQSINTSRQSEADHLIYYCYGWAKLEDLELISNVYPE